MCCAVCCLLQHSVVHVACARLYSVDVHVGHWASMAWADGRQAAELATRPHACPAAVAVAAAVQQ